MNSNEAIEHATDSFYAWELRGRGYALYNGPVALEPPYEPLYIDLPSTTTNKSPLENTSVFDYLKQGIKGIIDGKQQVPEIEYDEAEYSFPNRPIPFNDTSDIRCYSLSPPKGFDLSVNESQIFLNTLSYASLPVSFEMIGTVDTIEIRITCREQDQNIVIGNLRSYFPKVAIQEENPRIFPFNQEQHIEIVDMMLAQEFMRPLNTPTRFNPDTLLPLMSVFEQLLDGEKAMIQILFTGCKQPWATGTVQSVSDGQGGSFFADAPEMLPLSKDKVKSPLHAVVVRCIAQGSGTDHSRQLNASVCKALSTQSRSQYNSLIPLPTKYPKDQHWQNVVRRQSNRLGMVLNTAELVSLVHIPSKLVTTSKLAREVLKTKRAPKHVLAGKYFLGTNAHLGKSLEVYIDDEFKKRHTYIIGNTGQGKSTLICNMILNDAEVGNGIALFDPHGDLVLDVMQRLPEHRLKDVVLFDPSDTEYPVGFNLLQAKTDIEKIVLSSDLIEVFKSRSLAWGDTMGSILANAVNAFLENDKGGTLLELRRFLLDEKFRAKYLKNVQDYSIRSYWENDFKQLRKNAISPLLTRLDTFLRPRVIRNMMAQKKGIDFNEVMNGKKILLVNLSQGLIGEENSYLLGTLILTKLQQAAQGRATMAKEDRHPFYIYLDEFHNFITPSMTQILSGARKYGLGLILANQQVSQISSYSPAIADSVLSNPATRICFRVGDTDAKALSNGFAFYDANDLQNLERGQCIVRVGGNTNDFNLVTNMLPDAINADENTKRIVEHTRNTYASTKEAVEAIVNDVSQFGEHQSKELIQEKEPEIVTPSEPKEPTTPVEKAKQEYLQGIIEQEEI